MIQKILVFEFITGGGFSQQELPESLAKEGMLMLKALVDELTLLTDTQVTIALDWRIKNFELPKNAKAVVVSSDQCIYDLLPKLIADADLVWPVAPEMEGALQKVTDLAEKKSKKLLNSSSQAVAICSDKLATIQCLRKQKISSVEGVQLDQFSEEFKAPWVIKPKDGAGCLNSYFVSDCKELIRIGNQLETKCDYLIQPYIKGISLSLSCLFREGKAWMLCCNRQLISIVDGKFELDSCIVNIADENDIDYQGLINRVVSAIPGLFGYVGIDFMLPELGEAMILEINPRLTTSYVGINQAIGFNVAKAVVELFQVDPIIVKTHNQQIIVSI